MSTGLQAPRHHLHLTEGPFSSLGDVDDDGTNIISGLLVVLVVGAVAPAQSQSADTQIFRCCSHLGKVADFQHLQYTAFWPGSKVSYVSSSIRVAGKER
eukprot:748277-Hanusia_phi.AAC.4